MNKYSRKEIAKAIKDTFGKNIPVTSKIMIRDLLTTKPKEKPCGCVEGVMTCNECATPMKQKIEGGMSKWTPKLKTIDLELADFPDIISKYTERLANKRAKAIDNFIGGYIPKWQAKVMIKFPFTTKLFGWEVEHWTKVGEFGTDIKLKRYGKFVAQLTITEIINL